MALDLGCLQGRAESFWQEEGQRVEKDFQLNRAMTKLISLKKNSHFTKVLKNRVINNSLFSIYCVKNFIKKKNNSRKLYISFVMKKKIGNSVRRNRIKRKLKSAVHKLLKVNGAINLNYTYIIFGKTKTYQEKSGYILKKMKEDFQGIKI
tara:strand:+ start:7214 stop:7663 length:450 start_codon:yes stop_codon:yes gene_type:complete